MMARVLLVGLAALSVALSVGVGCTAPVPGDDAPRGRLVVVDEDGDSICLDDDITCFVDFGEVRSGDVVERSFFVENRGDAALTLPRYTFVDADDDGRGAGAGGYALDDDRPRTLTPGDRAAVLVRFTAADAGARSAVLVIDDGDDDEDGDVAITLRADVLGCGAAGAVIDVVSVNGSDGARDPFLVGDVVVLAVRFAGCQENPEVSTSWRLLSGPAGGSLQQTDDRAVVDVINPGDTVVEAVLTDDDGNVVAAPTFSFRARRAHSFSIVLGGARVHVVRDSLAWCSDDDCFAGHCDVGWGLRGEAPDVTDSTFALANASSGTYTVAGVADDDTSVSLRAGVDGSLGLEVVRQLRAGEPRLLARIVVEDDSVVLLDLDDTGPQPGDCF